MMTTGDSTSGLWPGTGIVQVWIWACCLMDSHMHAPAMDSGRPLGGAAFRALLETRLNRVLDIRKVGRPRGCRPEIGEVSRTSADQWAERVLRVVDEQGPGRAPLWRPERALPWGLVRGP